MYLSQATAATPAVLPFPPLLPCLHRRMIAWSWGASWDTQLARKKKKLLWVWFYRSVHTRSIVGMPPCSGSLWKGVGMKNHSARTVWECVPKRSTAVGRSQMLSWEWKSQTLIGFVMSFKGAHQLMRQDRAPSVQASALCLLEGCSAPCQPQGCSLRGCMIAVAGEFELLTHCHI